jgi:hypothetical protein
MPGSASLFANRPHWALTYMYRGGLVRRPRRGVVQITPRGHEVLAKHPGRVDLHILSQFKESIEFRGSPRGLRQAESGTQDDSAEQRSILFVPAYVGRFCIHCGFLFRSGDRRAVTSIAPADVVTCRARACPLRKSA